MLATPPAARRPRWVGQTFFDLGLLYQAQERWADAEPALVQGLLIAREIGDRRREANALGNLGVVYAALEQTEKAIRQVRGGGNRR